MAIKLKAPKPPVYLSVSAVAKRYDVSHATIWRWVKSDPNFPAPIKLSPGTSRWAEDQLIAFEGRARSQQRAKTLKPKPCKSAAS